MMNRRGTAVRMILTAVTGLLLAGCGGEDKPGKPSATGDTAAASPASTPARVTADKPVQTPPPTVSIPSPAPLLTEPAEGTAEWYLDQIRQARRQTAKEGATLEELRSFRRTRNKDIIDLATQVIAITHADKSKTELFTEGARELLEARLQLALQGDRKDIDELYQDADSLTKRDEKSKASMLAAHTLVRFANTNAQRYAEKEPRWLDEFSRQARMFAARFPEETTYSIPLLNSAAVTCELHGHVQEAELCYRMLADQYPDTPQGQFSVGVLRRLELAGRPIEFAGNTLEGGFISIDDFKGRVVLIVFWSSDDEDFAQQLPALKELYDKYHPHGLEIVGVCLDEDEAALNEWLEKNPLPWQQIFFAEKQFRRWSNPIVQYYGVREIPVTWLVDHHGVVQSTDIDPRTAEPKVRELLLALRAEKTSEPD